MSGAAGGDARRVLLGWTLFGLSAGVSVAVMARAFDRPIDGWVFATPILSSCVWAALTPLAARLVRKFPLAPGRLLPGVLALVLAAPALVLVHEVLFQPLMVVAKVRSVEPALLWCNTRDNLRENFLRLLTVGWGLVAILHSVAIARREQAAALHTARLEAEVAEADLAIARAEVDPAFLLGTLDALGPLILRDGRAAEEVIVRLGDLLRRAYAGDDVGSPSRKEIVREIGRLAGGAGPALTAPRPAGS